MRLDRFLKNARLLSRRSAAKEEAGEGRVLVNGRPAKPARDVRPGDRLTLLPSDPDRQDGFEIEVLAEPLRPIPKGGEGSFCRRVPPDAGPRRP